MPGTQNPLKSFRSIPLGNGEFSLMWLGQGSFAYRFGNLATVLVDPYLTDTVERRQNLTRLLPILVEPVDVEGDLLLVTHDHWDHFDEEPVLCGVLSSKMRVMGPRSCHIHYSEMGLPEAQFTELNRGDSFTSSGIAVKAVYAEHHSRDSLKDAVGYILQADGLTIYHLGDSEYTEDVVSAVKGLKPDIMIVPINGRWGNMNGAEAAHLAVDTGAKAVFPMHFGMFVENTCDPMLFADAMKELACPAEILFASPFTPMKLVPNGLKPQLMVIS